MSSQAYRCQEQKQAMQGRRDGCDFEERTCKEELPREVVAKCTVAQDVSPKARPCIASDTLPHSGSKSVLTWPEVCMQSSPSLLLSLRCVKTLSVHLHCEVQFEEEYLKSVIGKLRVALSSTWSTLHAAQRQAYTTASLVGRVKSWMKSFSSFLDFTKSSSVMGSEVCKAAPSHLHCVALSVEEFNVAKGLL
jgi:hypothetical protein